MVGIENPSDGSYKEQTTLDPTGHGGRQQPGNGCKAGAVAMLYKFIFPLSTLDSFLSQWLVKV